MRWAIPPAPAPFFPLSFLRCSTTTSLRVVRVLYLRGTRVDWIDSLRFLHKLGRTSGWHSLAEITLITVGLKIWITQFINTSNLVTYKLIYLEEHQIRVLCPYHRGCPEGSLLLTLPSNTGDRPTRDQNPHDQKTKDERHTPEHRVRSVFIPRPTGASYKFLECSGTGQHNWLHGLPFLSKQLEASRKFQKGTINFSPGLLPGQSP
jgi:hypothetical protein